MKGRDKISAREARRRRLEIVPHLAGYNQLPSVFWPFLLSVSKPDFAGEVVTTDTRGHRVTRVGAESTRSDHAPEGASFLLGGSFSFGVGASDDAHTLAAALWRRTGTPYVNLGIRAATSLEELISVVPFAERRATFVVCSGLNNLASAGLEHLAEGRASAVDPLFGPTYDEGRLRILASHSISELARLAGDPLGRLGDRELRQELRSRRQSRIHRRLRRVRRLRKRVRGFLSRGAPEPVRAPADSDALLDGVVAEAASRQLTCLRLLRRLLPEEARLVFALQPIAWGTGKELSSEERELFDLLDLVQPVRWHRLRSLLETRWPSYSALLDEGCGAVSVPFVDLARGDYSGWCFIDRVHMTDRGYEAAAAALEEVLRDGDR